MNLRNIVIILINSIVLLSCASTHKVYLEGEKKQPLGYKFYSNYSFDPLTNIFDEVYLDSLDNHYNGIATKLLYNRRDPNNLNKSELDSMCISNGLRTGYSKQYATTKRDNAIGITYIHGNCFNLKNNNSLDIKYKIDVGYDLSLQPKEMVLAYIKIYKHNINFTFSFYKFKNICRVKVIIERSNDKLGYKYMLKTKHKAKFKDKSKLESFLMLYPELVSQEILEKCRSLGMFDNRPIEDPIIKGNCK